MSLLFETIRLENGIPRHLAWHEQRMNRARGEIWHENDPVILGPLIIVPAEFSSGLVRCNIMYGPGVQSITFKHYEKRIIRSLKIVTSGFIDYHLKFTDRTLLETLFACRAECDEIIIVNNGLITDTSMSNIIFSDGKSWYTPAQPLLKGTCRERLVAEGRLAEREIRAEDVATFTGCKLINAMRDPEEEILIPVSQIVL